jgi:hypothetical protein
MGVQPRKLRQKTLTASAMRDKTPGNDLRRRYVANHLTPTELADEVNMKRREVISKCMEMGVPIFNGRIDKTLFVSSMRQFTEPSKQAQAAH